MAMEQCVANELPFLLFLFPLSLSLSSTFFERVEKILGTNEPRARASMPVNPQSPDPSWAKGHRFFRISGKTMKDLACASLQPLSFNLSFDFSSLSTLFTRLTEIYDGVRSISLSAASFSPTYRLHATRVPPR